MSSTDLESQLRGGGEVVAEGTFKVDAQRALMKLREHRLTEPHHWVLEVLRAAHLSKATRVELRIDADDVEVSFDGKAFPRAAMLDLLAQALGTGEGPDEQRSRLLALGVSGALGLHPKYIRVQSGGVKVEVSRDDKVTVTESKSFAKGTQVAVKKSLGWNVLQGLINRSPEHAAILDRARWFTCPLLVNGERVDGRLALDGAKILVQRRDDRDGIAVLTGFVRSGEKAHRLSLVSQGVLIARREFEAPGLPCHVVAYCDDLRRNASGSDVVDADPVTVKVFAKVRAQLLLTSADAFVALAEGRLPEGVRDDVSRYLLDPSTGGEFRALLEQAPVLPGPAGEWYPVADFRKETSAKRHIRYALSPCPKASYPAPTVLLSTLEDDWRLPMLPEPPTENIETMVLTKTRVAANKEAWQRQPIEQPQVTSGGSLARASIAAAAVTGEVSLTRSAGAFVRFLAQGRYVQQGEVQALGPLRLRATVDYKKTVPDELWAELPTRKLFSLVLKEIETGYERALEQALASGPPDADLLAHAGNLLERWARAGKPLNNVPAWLSAVPLFRTLGGQRVALSTLQGSAVWNYTPQMGLVSLISGERVLALTEEERAILSAWGEKKLRDVSPRLAKEREVRRRIAGPKANAELVGMVVSQKLDGVRFKGAVGVPSLRGSQLTLRLLKDGLEVETTTLSALYGLASAVVDCAEFQVSDDWFTVVRDATFDAALHAVREAEATLAEKLFAREQSWNALPPGATQHLLAFLVKEVDLAATAPPSPLLKQALEAKLFATSKGLRSLLELKAAVATQGALYVSPPEQGGPPPSWRSRFRAEAEALMVLIADDALADGLGKLLKASAQSPEAELTRLRALNAFRAARVREPVVEIGRRPRCTVKVDGVRGEIGLALQDLPGANLELLVEGRLWREERLPAGLPLVGCVALEGIDPLSNVLPAESSRQLVVAVRTAEDGLLRLALNDLQNPDARRILFIAIGGHFDNRGTTETGRVFEADLFPCTDGKTRSAKALEKAGPVRFVTRRLEGVPAVGGPVVVAADLEVLLALPRFGGRQDVTESLSRELEARALRARVAPREHIRCEGEVALRRAFSANGLEGEVCFSGTNPGRLELFTEKKPFCVLDGELPGGLMAAVNCDRLQVGSDGHGVTRDKAFRAVHDLVLAEAHQLGVELARAWAAMTAPVQEGLRRDALKLAVWAVKADEGAQLAALPLLETTAGEPLALARLLTSRSSALPVRYASARIAPLDAQRWVWCPRPGEREVLEPLRLKLTDYSDELVRAEQVRSRPKEVSLAVAGFRAWVEPVQGKETSGEVALHEHFEATLTIDLLREHTHLELWSSKHPIGGVAKVNSDALAPTAAWKRAVRNRAFKTLVEDVETALERLVARRLDAGPRDAESRRLAVAALGWSRAPDGPLAKVLPTLTLFTSLAGTPVAVGAVVDEQARKRRVCVAREGLAAPEGGLVLADTSSNRTLLSALKMEVEDVSGLLERAHKLEELQRARRLSGLSVEGEMLVRVAVDRDGTRGELALPSRERGDHELTLARNGIAVCPFAVEGDLPVVGVIDSPDLEVNEDWTHARPDGKLQALIAERVEALYLALATRAESGDAGFRPAARDRALQLVAHRGMAHAPALGQMSGAAAALARVPLFSTPRGEWLTLAALADHVALGGKVGILTRRLLTPDVGEALVVVAESLKDPWVEALKAVLGPGSIERIENLADFKRNLAEADPQGGTPTLKGLVRLRKQLKLLRAGALGRLTPDELEDVRLSTAKMKRRVDYDPARRLLLLDGNDAQVLRALEDAPQRPERLYVLLAACYGEVNRALERITDAHEADLLAALAVHLASNPEHLSPAAAPTDKEGT